MLAQAVLFASVALFGVLAEEHDRFAGMIDVGGHRVYLECTGSGAPAVVLEADLQGSADDWAAVQLRVAGFTRVCSYDRAGRGRSDPTPAPASGEQAVEDLRIVLAGGGIPAPYVLVGNGFGGLLMRVYASRYPRDVAGLVFVDPDDESLAMRFQEVGPSEARASYRRWLREDLDGQAVAATYAAARSGGPLPAVPLVVLTHGQGPVFDRTLEVHRQLAQSVPGGKHQIAQHSAALEIPREQPDLVIEAIQAMVNAHSTPPSSSTGLMIGGAAVATLLVGVLLVRRYARRSSRAWGERRPA